MSYDLVGNLLLKEADSMFVNQMQDAILRRIAEISKKIYSSLYYS